MFCIQVPRELLLELCYRRAHYEPGSGKHRLERLVDFGLKAAELGRQINKRYGIGSYRRRHCASSFSSSPSRAASPFLKTLAGFPTTTAPAGTSFVTTAPAPTSAPSPIVTLQRMTAPDPIEAPRFTTVGCTFQSASV